MIAIETILTLVVRGFNRARNTIQEVDGAVELLTDAGDCAAAWSFADLTLKWNKKHAQAAYVHYESEKNAAPAYRYTSPVLMGEGTDFNRYLAALCSGLVIFDPASKLMNASSAKSSIKPRSQFRMSIRNLAVLTRNSNLWIFDVKLHGFFNPRSHQPMVAPDLTDI